MKTVQVITEERLVFDPKEDMFEELTIYGNVAIITTLEKDSFSGFNHITEITITPYINNNNREVIRVEKDVMIITKNEIGVYFEVITRKEYNEKYTEII